MKRSRSLKLSRSLGAAAAGILLAVSASAAGANQDVAVRGRVVDQGGTPLGAIVVRVADSAGLHESVKTDKHGYFSAIGLVLGNVTLEINHYGFNRGVVTTNVKAGQTAQCDFALAHSGSITRSQATCRIVPETTDRTIVN